jgi:transposase
MDKARRAEFCRQGQCRPGPAPRQALALLRSWASLDREDCRLLAPLLALNRRLAKAHLLTEQLGQLRGYTYEGAAWRLLMTWIKALRWQRLPAFVKAAVLLLRHLDGILAYCHEKVPFGTVEAITRNMRPVLRRGRGYRDREYLLLPTSQPEARVGGPGWDVR